MENRLFIVAIFFALTSSASFAAVQTPSLGAPVLVLTPRVQLVTAKPVSLGVPTYGAPVRVSMAVEVRSRFGNPNQKSRSPVNPVHVYLGQSFTVAPVPTIKR